MHIALTNGRAFNTDHVTLQGDVQMNACSCLEGTKFIIDLGSDETLERFLTTVTGHWIF
jgi:hypothetical protein